MSRFSAGFLFKKPQPSSPDALFGTALAAWYKADVGVSLSGSAVTSWADQSGHSVTLSQATSGLRPTFDATGFNGKSTIKFDTANTGPGASCLASAATAIGTGGNKNSLFMVANLRALGHANDSWLVAFLRGTGGGFPWNNVESCVWMNLDRTTNKLQETTNSINNAAATVSTSTLYRLGMVMDATNITNYVNNAQAAQTAFTATMQATGQLQVGAEVGSESLTYGVCDISEIVVVSRDATTGERSTLDDYFRTKWGL